MHMGQWASEAKKWEYTHTVYPSIGALPSYSCGSQWDADLYGGSIYDQERPRHFRIPKQPVSIQYTGRPDFDQAHFSNGSKMPICPESNVPIQRLTCFEASGAEAILYLPCSASLSFFAGGISSLITQIIEGGLKTTKSSLQIFVPDLTYWRDGVLHLMLGRNTSSAGVRAIGRIVADPYLRECVHEYHRCSIAISKSSPDISIRGAFPTSSDATISVFARRLVTPDGRNYYLADHIVDYDDASQPFRIIYGNIRDGNIPEDNDSGTLVRCMRRVARLLSRISLYFRRPDINEPVGHLTIQGLANMWRLDKRYPCARLPRDVTGTQVRVEEDLPVDTDNLSLGHPSADGEGSRAEIAPDPSVTFVDIDLGALFDNLVKTLCSGEDCSFETWRLSLDDLNISGVPEGPQSNRRPLPSIIYLARIHDATGKIYYLIDCSRSGFDARCFWVFHDPTFIEVERFYDVSRDIVIRGFSSKSINRGGWGVVRKPFHHTHLPLEDNPEKFEYYASRNALKISAYINSYGKERPPRKRKG